MNVCNLTGTKTVKQSGPETQTDAGTQPGAHRRSPSI